MNKTVAFLAFTAIAFAGIGGSAYILVERPDASATFAGLLTNVLAVTAGFAATLYGLGKTNEKLAEVSRQTNGTLSRKDDELAVKDETISNKDKEIAILVAENGRLKGQENGS